MRIKPAMAALYAASVCCGITATTTLAQSVESPRNVTFKLTSLTRSGLPLQHAIQNYVTLSMVEVGSSRAISIDDPPPFPLIATLHYYDGKGQTRKVSSSYGYRC